MKNQVTKWTVSMIDKRGVIGFTDGLTKKEAEEMVSAYERDGYTLNCMCHDPA